MRSARCCGLERGDWGRSGGCVEVRRSKENLKSSFQSSNEVQKEGEEKFCLWNSVVYINICSLKWKSQEKQMGKGSQVPTYVRVCSDYIPVRSKHLCHMVFFFDSKNRNKLTCNKERSQIKARPQVFLTTQWHFLMSQGPAPNISVISVLNYCVTCADPSRIRLPDTLPLSEKGNDDVNHRHVILGPAIST